MRWLFLAFGSRKDVYQSAAPDCCLIFDCGSFGCIQRAVAFSAKKKQTQTNCNQKEVTGPHSFPYNQIGLLKC